MEKYFKFYADKGVMLDANYPYAMADQSCEQTASSAIEQTADWATF